MKPTIGIALAASVLLGCSRPAVHVLHAADPQLQAGWTLTDDAQDGIKLGLPSGWHEGADTAMSGLGMADQVAGDSSMQGADANNAMNALSQQMQADDAAQQKEALAKLREKGIVINVIDSSKPIPGEVRNQFYVKKVDHDGNWSLDQARDDEVEFYRGWGADKPQLVSLPIGKAYRFSCDYKTRGGDEVERISFVVVDGKETYLLRFVSTNNPDVVKSIADSVAQTWRIKPGAG